MKKQRRPFKPWAIRVPPYYVEKLRLLREQTDISMSEHIRIALREYFIKMKVN